MSGYTITKTVDFCFGHRVHTQILNSKYSLDSNCACRHLHGHQGRIDVSLSAKQLVNGMVSDFKHLNFFKKWIDDYFDHKMILDIDDPLVPYLLKEFSSEWKSKLIGCEIEGVKFINPESYINLYSFDTCMREFLSGLVFVPFVPTSENMSRFFAERISKHIQPILDPVQGWTSSVTFFETPKSSSRYDT